jgi:hypothetical protein
MAIARRLGTKAFDKGVWASRPPSYPGERVGFARLAMPASFSLDRAFSFAFLLGSISRA